MLLLVLLIPNNYLENRHYLFYCLSKQPYNFDVEIKFWMSAVNKRIRRLVDKIYTKDNFLSERENIRGKKLRENIQRKKIDSFEQQSKFFKTVKFILNKILTKKNN